MGADEAEAAEARGNKASDEARGAEIAPVESASAQSRGDGDAFEVALEGATAAGRWDLVAQITAELLAHHPASRPQPRVVR